MSKKIIVRFYNWQDWKKNISEANIGSLGSNKKNQSMLRMAAHEAQNEDNEVWLITASKIRNGWFPVGSSYVPDLMTSQLKTLNIQL
ncbi:hypothetical protein [Methylophilus sp.]|uniref:hypothetical protein n=1 Tax=Methylophilus sp. TaxID=29541 RepID=UPI0025FDB0A3|nr:hypothetical protein [Methylophilus sp.]